MPHCVQPVRQKGSGIRYVGLPVAAVMALLLLQVPYRVIAQNAGETTDAQAQQPQAQVPAQKNSIVKILAQRVDDKKLEISIFCTTPPSYTVHEIPGGDRTGIYVDIANGDVPPNSLDSSSLSAFKITCKGQQNADIRRLRLEFKLPESYTTYSASVKDSNIILLIENFFKDTPAAASAASGEAAPLSIPASGAALSSPTSEAAKQNMPGGESLQAHLPPNSLPTSLKSAGGVGSSPAAGMPPAAKPLLGGDADGLITVDFFKVDLHNVFRLLGEISGYNIIVTEGVSGTLTLALHEVPWDFVLDIILNLKDLAKEERHNTMVIYPKSKEFVWPQKTAAEDSLKIESEGTGKAGKSPIVMSRVGEQAQQAELTEAKKFAALAIKVEKEGSLETAVQLYEKALDAWPDKVEKKEKSKLANKIASIYLAGLNQNAKAVYFAQKALAADKKNSSAALNAAIGHANMEEYSQAQQYFDQSVTVSSPPSKEALFNYAVFSERQKQYDAALRLLKKYSDLYGENIDSMVSRARILDQQGRREDADKVYTAILHAGFSVPPDLRAFIMGRVQSN